MKDFIALKQAAGEQAMKSDFEDFFKGASKEQMEVRTVFSCIEMGSNRLYRRGHKR